MVQIAPFRGLRYDISQVGSLSDVTAPPYDVIDREAQDALYQQHPCNVIRLILNRDEPGDPSPDEKYRRAAEFLRHWQQDGVLVREREEALYVYHQSYEWEGRSYVRKGFIGRLRLEEFGSGEVFPHEETMSGPKEDRLKLLKACRTNLSPIFGLYPDDDQSVQQPLEEAILSATPLEATEPIGVTHRMWVVTDRGAIEAVRTQLRDKPVFIADGHHRYETALNYRNWLRSQPGGWDEGHPANYVMMAFVGMSDPGLTVLPTHRLVSGVGEVTASSLQTMLESHFTVEEMPAGPDAARETWERMQADGGQHVFGLAGTSDGRWLFASLNDLSPMQELAADRSEQWRSLGVSILHRLVLGKLLPAHWPQAEPAFRYVHRLDEVSSAVRDRTCDLACLVQPPTLEHIRAIASQFEKMPPKSTYFYPKLLSGLVFNPLE